MINGFVYRIALLSIACASGLASAVMGQEGHAQPGGWQCVIDTVPAGHKSALFKGPFLLGAGSGVLSSEGRVTSPFIHVVNGRPVRSEVIENSDKVLKMSWRVDNTGQAPALAFTQVLYAADLDKQNGTLKMRATASGYGGMSSVSGRCHPRISQ